MITTNSIDLYKKAWSIKDHGKNYDDIFNKHHSDGFRWLHDIVGTNWRMTPIQAVIGIIALDELKTWVNHRREIASIYNKNLSNIEGIRITIPPDNIYHSYYKYYFFIELDKFDITRDEIIKLINDKGIFCQIGSCSEVYLEEALYKYKPDNNLPITQELFKTTILLKCDPSITEKHATFSMGVIKSILNNSIIK